MAMGQVNELWRHYTVAVEQQRQKILRLQSAAQFQQLQQQQQQPPVSIVQTLWPAAFQPINPLMYQPQVFVSHMPPAEPACSKPQPPPLPEANQPPPPPPPAEIIKSAPPPVPSIPVPAGPPPLDVPHPPQIATIMPPAGANITAGTVSSEVDSQKLKDKSNRGERTREEFEAKPNPFDNSAGGDGVDWCRRDQIAWDEEDYSQDYQEADHDPDAHFSAPSSSYYWPSGDPIRDENPYQPPERHGLLGPPPPPRPLFCSGSPPPPPRTDEGYAEDVDYRFDSDTDMRRQPLMRPSSSWTTFHQRHSASNSPMRPQSARSSPVMIARKTETVSVDDLLNEPGRHSRPQKFVIILRGLPGAGKTYLAKLLKEREAEKCGVAPRILCLDDYFMVENEKETKDPRTGRRKKERVLEYEYDEAMEPSYRAQLFKSYKKTVEDGFFNFVIVDSVNYRVNHFDEMWSVGKQNGFQVYIAELTCDVATCVKRNIHQRTKQEIEKVHSTWEETPAHYLRLDCTSLLQDASITEVDMEVEMDDVTPAAGQNSDTGTGGWTLAKPKVKTDGDSDEDPADVTKLGSRVAKSKWELLDTEAKLDKLDGMKLKRHQHNMSDYLLPDDYEEARTAVKSGKKRVRWADIEEQKKVDREKAIGFVIGGTDWSKLTDQYDPSHVLEKTKYI